MQLVSYLWGTNEKEYCELARFGEPERFFAEHGAKVPGAALSETKRLLFPGGGENTAVTVRFAPMHLGKMGMDDLAGMKSFCALCVSGPEKADGTRESTYSLLTLIDPKEMLTDKEKDLPDVLFGRAPMDPAQEGAFRKGEGKAGDLSDPGTADVSLREQDLALVKFIISVLYHDPGSRVVVRLAGAEDFLKEAFRLLSQVWSLLPPRMGLETGFAIGEPAENIPELSRTLNTRVFVIPAETVPDERSLPAGTIVADAAETSFDEDAEMSRAVTLWADPEAAADGRKFSFETQKEASKKRLAAMKYAFAGETEYWSRAAYLADTAKFFGDPYFAWEREEKAPFVPADGEVTYDTVKAVYALFRQFPYLGRVDWMRDRFTARIPELIGEGRGVSSLKKAIVKSYSALDKENGENANAIKNHQGFLNWLTTLDDADVTLESAEEVAKYVREKTESLKEKEKEEALSAQQEEYESRLDDEKKRNEALQFSNDNLDIIRERVVEAALRESDARWEEKMAALKADLQAALTENEKLVDSLNDLMDRGIDEERAQTLEKENAMLKERTRSARKKYNERIADLETALIVKPALLLIAGLLLGYLFLPR